MRQLASAPERVFSVGDLVVIDGHGGAFRVDAVFDDGAVRAFSYVDGRFVVVDEAAVRPCPPNTPAAG